jgi:hypothetical protein
MNLHQNALECNTNIQNTPLILEIPEANIFFSEVERFFPNLYKYEVETIFSNNMGRKINPFIILNTILVFSYNIVRPTNYFTYIKIEKRSNLLHIVVCNFYYSSIIVQSVLFFVTNTNSLHFFLNTLSVLRNLIEIPKVFAKFKYFWRS